MTNNTINVLILTSRYRTLSFLEMDIDPVVTTTATEEPVTDFSDSDDDFFVEGSWKPTLNVQYAFMQSLQTPTSKRIYKNPRQRRGQDAPEEEEARQKESDKRIKVPLPLIQTEVAPIWSPAYDAWPVSLQTSYELDLPQACSSAPPSFSVDPSASGFPP